MLADEPDADDEALFLPELPPDDLAAVLPAEPDFEPVFAEPRLLPLRPLPVLPDEEAPDFEPPLLAEVPPRDEAAFAEAVERAATLFAPVADFELLPFAPLPDLAELLFVEPFAPELPLAELALMDEVFALDRPLGLLPPFVEEELELPDDLPDVDFAPDDFFAEEADAPEDFFVDEPDEPEDLFAEPNAPLVREPEPPDRDPLALAAPPASFPVTLSAAAPIAPTAAPVAAPPRISLATSITLSMMLEAVLFGAERFDDVFEPDDEAERPPLFEVLFLSAILFLPKIDN